MHCVGDQLRVKKRVLCTRSNIKTERRLMELKNNVRFLAVSMLMLSVTNIFGAQPCSDSWQVLQENAKHVISSLANPTAPKSEDDHKMAAAMVKLCQDYQTEYANLPSYQPISSAALLAFVTCQCHKKRPDKDVEGLQNCFSAVKALEKLVIDRAKK